MRKLIIAVLLIAVFMSGCNAPPDEALNYHAPVLLDRSTGEMLELRVYQNDMANPGQLASKQRRGYMQVEQFEGMTLIVCGGESSSITLPAKKESQCVILDPESLTKYPIAIGSSYEIGSYQVSFEQREAGSIVVTCTGLLDFDWYDE